MGPVSADVEIDVSREAAFELIADLSARPSFTDHFLEGYRLTRIEASGVGAGARFRISGPLQGTWFDTTIDEVDPAHRILEHGHGGRNNRVATTTLWELTPGPGLLSTVRVSFWTEPTNFFDRAHEALGGIAVGLERDLREALRRMRELLEDGVNADTRVAVAGGNRHATGIF
jgi:hypothetical protein